MTSGVPIYSANTNQSYVYILELQFLLICKIAKLST